ncbi:serine hydrolase [Neobacillus kokaensis]|uniref:Serine hydrolase n=1 Tax=Neobacillus kokaensis TaxID=2759023 RepID=A0ABQ3MZD6_9BACI|nr:serine hydrolase [Neobacillus kokaensis]GHH96757.1 serine hydrolase [Neobacillus kokaensis]
MLEFEEKLIGALAGLRGKAGVSIEIEGECFNFNSEEVFPSASVIKVPILIEGLRQAEAGEISLNQVLSIQDRVGGSGVLQTLSDQVTLTVKDLLTLMITVSDNTATNMMIDLLGMDAINQSMKKLGLEKTVLKRKMMDFAAIQRGLNNVTTASDLITCLKVITEGDCLSEKSQKLALEIMTYQQFHDKLSGAINTEKILVASKSGSLPGVENDCAIFKYQGKTAYAAVLMDQLEDEYNSRRVISKIGKGIYDCLIDKCTDP